MNTTYEILEAFTTSELQKMVQMRLNEGAILEGGVSSVAITIDNGHGIPELHQTFYQAVSYIGPRQAIETSGEPVDPPEVLA